MELTDIAKEIANKAGMPYAHDDVLNRLKEGIPLPFRLSDDTILIDCDMISIDRLKTAASKSEWMPPEYTMNDWIYDLEQYLLFGMREAEALKEIKTLREKIEAAKNCLVCAAIADPSEVIENTYEILKKD